MKRLPPRVATLLAAFLLAASVAVTPAAGHPRDRQYDYMDPPTDYMGDPDGPDDGMPTTTSPGIRKPLYTDPLVALRANIVAFVRLRLSRLEVLQLWKRADD